MAQPTRRSPFERILSVALGVALAFGCAKQVNTLEPLDESEPHGSSGATASKGGHSSASAGSGSGGKPSTGGSAIHAFGGSATSGGTAGSANDMGRGGTADAGAGGGSGSSQGGGTAQAGSSQGGSSAGTAGRGGGGSGGSGGSGLGGAMGSGCLMSWRDNDACDTCTMQTQSDKKACAQVLDCYLQNDCGPATCAGNDDECGANTIKQGTAPYPVAQDVYDCICN